MENLYSRLLAFGRYLIPKNNRWLKRIFIVFSFILLDYFATLAFCTSPAEEANPHLRVFLESYGIVVGLTLFDFLINLPIYLILCFDSHLVSLPARFSKIVEPLVDLVLAWFLAGAHFSGATSWFWVVPDLTRQAVGFGIYLIIAINLYLA
ncbi:MAG: hypothetical protein ACUVRA_02695 [Candidatus Bathyarchaeaceae archaeon]